MRFELRPAYPDWPDNGRKSLHVDAEAYEALSRFIGDPEGIMSVIPPEVLTELERPIYGPGMGSDAVQLWGMGVFVDL